MKKALFLAAVVITISACRNKSEEVKVDETKVETPGDTITGKDTVAVQGHFASFGDKILAENALTPEEMLKKYNGLKPGDTISVKFRSKVNEVCKKKGCWMSMELPDEKESFVKFRDYAFFVPKNADNSEAIVSGKAFVDVVSVAELQHYAKDGGKSPQEISKITEPKITYAFQADGVLIKE